MTLDQMCLFCPQKLFTFTSPTISQQLDSNRMKLIFFKECKKCGFQQYSLPSIIQPDKQEKYVRKREPMYSREHKANPKKDNKTPQHRDSQRMWPSRNHCKNPDVNDTTIERKKIFREDKKIFKQER